MITKETLELYRQLLPLREMGEVLNVEPQALRRALLKEGLAIKKRDRLESLAAYNSRGEGSHNQTKIIGEHPYKKIHQLEKALQQARDELNYRRSLIRTEARQEEVLERIQEIAEEIALNYPQTQTVLNVQPMAANIPEWGLCAVLSDIHLGEIVNSNDVPGNEYNYSIAHRRINHFIQEVINNPKQSKNLTLFLCKDDIRGLIHEGLVESQDSVVESITQVVSLYTNIINTLSVAYDSVTIWSTGSNHERLSEKPSAHKKYADFGRLADIMTKRIIEAQGTSNITWHTTDSGYQLVNVNGANILAFHGDTVRSYNAASEPSRAKLQTICMGVFGGQTYRHAVSGHTHQFIAAHNNYDGMNIVNSSAVGTNSY